MRTIPARRKIPARTADLRVAPTIDILGPPPRVLLARGRAELATVEGVPDGHLDSAHRIMPREAWDGFDAQVRQLYEQLVTITIRPDWA